MSKRREDPVNIGDFYDFKAYVESELSSLRKEQEWVRKSLDRLHENIQKLERVIAEYKWWIISSFFSATALFTLLAYLMEIFT